MRLSSFNGVNSFIRRPRLHGVVVSAGRVNNSSIVLGHGFRKRSQGFVTSAPQQKKIEAKHSTPPAGEAVEANKSASKALRKQPSLRQVAVEAERSRVGIVRRHGGREFINPGAFTKIITAYCAAEQYNISTVAQILKKKGYTLDPSHTNLYPQVVHVKTLGQIEDSISQASQERGDVFVFPSGTVVAWNVSGEVAERLLNEVLKPAAHNSHEVEVEDLDYVEHPNSRTSTIIGDTIVLGTNVDTTASDPSEAEGLEQEGNAETNLALAKVAFSSGLSRSAKLGVLENLFEHYFHSTKSIPIDLAKGSNLPFDRRFILSKTGELLNIRAQLNLYSELTDSLPDMLWDSKSELGLEDYFDKVGRVLDVSVRIKTLNQRMDYATEIATVLGERLSEKHGWTLEWYIIALIALELIFETYRFVKEAQDRRKEDEVRELLKDVLKKVEISR